MTCNPLLQQIDAIAKEKGVEPEVIIGAVQDAIEAAARKRYKNEDAAGEVQPRDRTDRALRREAHRRGSHRSARTRSRWPKRSSSTARKRKSTWRSSSRSRPTTSGRIAAQTAKQVIFQKVREAERENVYAESSKRVGEVVNGIVKRFENGDIIMELGRHRSAAAAQGTVARGELHRRRPRARRHPRREPRPPRGRRSCCRAPIRPC